MPSAMEAPEPHAPLTPALAAAKARERRQGLVLAALGLLGGVGALAAAIRHHLSAPLERQRAPTIVYLASMAVYGIGLYRALFAPRADPGGLPRHVRPWAAVVLTLLTMWLLAQLAGFAAGALGGVSGRP